MAKVGRPSEYDFSLCEEICELVARGGNIVAVLESDERFPSWPTFRKWKNQHEELLTLYVKAIQDKAESVDLSIDETIQWLLKGEIDPSTANVIIQTYKWKASKYYPKMFGTQTNVDITSGNKPIQSTTITIDALSKLTDNESIED